MAKLITQKEKASSMVPLKRMFAQPLDIDSYFTSLNDAVDYAKNSPNAYVGQILTIVDPTIDSGNPVYYKIVNRENPLAEFGTATTTASQPRPNCETLAPADIDNLLNGRTLSRSFADNHPVLLFINGLLLPNNYYTTSQAHEDETPELQLTLNNGTPNLKTDGYTLLPTDTVLLLYYA